MGFERIGRQVTYRATCDQCGHAEDVIATETDVMDAMPQPWYGFVAPHAYYTDGDLKVVCSQECAVKLCGAAVQRLMVSREPVAA